MDFDEGFQEWRYRHVKLVERTIGAKLGTGGTVGVDFLKRSLFRPLFPDLLGGQVSNVARVLGSWFLGAVLGAHVLGACAGEP